MIRPLVKIDDKLEDSIAFYNRGRASGDWLIELRRHSGGLSGVGSFPSEMVRNCAAVEAAVSSDKVCLLQYYVWLASGCLTTSFILSQRSAALKRIETCENESARSRLLEAIQKDHVFATVGVSHLTTSGLHLGIPSLTATRVSNGWVLEGACPWVTGGAFAEWLVVGAVEASCVSAISTMPKPNELLCAIPRKATGVQIEPSCNLVALDASSTGPVRFESVFVDDSNVLHGPVANVMEASNRSAASLSPPSAGGLQTSALAIGHAAQAIEYLVKESAERVDLAAVATGLQLQWLETYETLSKMNTGDLALDASSVRKKSNDLALKSTQAALVAAKGAGFLNSHDAGRWCREAMFFLVWSCPHSVAQAHLCSFLN